MNSAGVDVDANTIETRTWLSHLSSPGGEVIGTTPFYWYRWTCIEAYWHTSQGSSYLWYRVAPLGLDGETFEEADWTRYMEYVRLKPDLRIDFERIFKLGGRLLGQYRGLDRGGIEGILIQPTQRTARSVPASASGGLNLLRHLSSQDAVVIAAIPISPFKCFYAEARLSLDKKTVLLSIVPRDNEGILIDPLEWEKYLGHKELTWSDLYYLEGRLLGPFRGQSLEQVTALLQVLCVPAKKIQ